MKYQEEMQKFHDLAKEGREAYNRLEVAYTRQEKINQRIQNIGKTIADITTYISPHELTKFGIKIETDVDQAGYHEDLTCNHQGFAYIYRYDNSSWGRKTSIILGTRKTLKVLTNPAHCEIIRETIKNTKLPKQVFETIMTLQPEITAILTEEQRQTIEVGFKQMPTLIETKWSEEREKIVVLANNIESINFVGHQIVIKQYHKETDSREDYTISTSNEGRMMQLAQMHEEIKESVEKLMKELETKEQRIQEIEEAVKKKTNILSMIESLDKEKSVHTTDRRW